MSWIGRPLWYKTMQPGSIIAHSKITSYCIKHSKSMQKIAPWTHQRHCVAYHYLWENWPGNLTVFCAVGESVDDCGGGYSESIAEMCDELQNGSVPLLILTPNGREESGANRDCFLLNPVLKSTLNQNMFRFLGEYCNDSIFHRLELTLFCSDRDGSNISDGILRAFSRKK